MPFFPSHLPRLVTLCAALGGLVNAVRAEPEAADSARDKAPVVMDAVLVEGNYIPKLSFGLSLNVWKDNNTRKVATLVISGVRAGSEAESKGLTAMMRITHVDGVPVQDLDATFFQGSALNKFFVDRRSGDKITLTIWNPGEKGESTIVLTEKSRRNLPFPSPLERFER